MKKLALSLVGGLLLASSTGCCCSHLFGGGCNPCGPCGSNSYYGGGYSNYGAGGCPTGNCNVGPTGMLTTPQTAYYGGNAYAAAPIAQTAYLPTESLPTY